MERVSSGNLSRTSLRTFGSTLRTQVDDSLSLDIGEARGEVR